MTLRIGRFLLVAALGLFGLSGCLPWQTTRTDTDDLRPLQPPVTVTHEFPPKQPERPVQTPPAVQPTLGTVGDVEFHASPPTVEPQPIVTGGSKAPTAIVVHEPEVPVGADTAAAKPAPAEPKQDTAKPEATKPEAAQPSPLVKALECILEDRTPEALAHLQAYDRETQEFYLRALPALTILARKRIEDLSAQEVAVLDEQLQSLLATLRPRTSLVIDRMCYCASVKSYGIYQPLPDGHAFVAPAGDRPGEVVRVYVEVRNFASVPKNGYFETRLASTIEIRDAHGQPVQPLMDFEDGKRPVRSRTRLNDYYNAYTFLVPPLPAGTYQLVLRITDETNPEARRVVEKTLEFRVNPVGTRPY